jgi:hypothetical protein
LASLAEGAAARRPQIPQRRDDDFPVFGVKWRLWARQFCDELHRVGLADRILWKIGRRADAVDADLFARMRDSGLYLVYMGLESGNEEGLRSLNRKITVQQNIPTVETLKRLGIRFEFGFMLFEPSTTFATVRDDLQFLRRIVGDGSTAAWREGPMGSSWNVRARREMPEDFVPEMKRQE